MGTEFQEFSSDSIISSRARRHIFQTVYNRHNRTRYLLRGELILARIFATTIQFRLDLAPKPDLI
jgi:hypothetical protein